MSDANPPAPARSRSRSRESIDGYIAGLTVFLFGVIAITGMLMSAYYSPSASPALSDDGRELGAARVTKRLTWLDARYESGETIALPMHVSGDSIDIPNALRGAVEPMRDSVSGRIVRASAAWTSVEVTISRSVELGRIVRSIHHYAASLFIASLLLQIVFLLIRFAARRPRIGEWSMRTALLALALLAAYTGSLLPWHQLAYTAARIGSSTLNASLGAAMATLMYGGVDVTHAALTRAHAVHVAVVPIVMVLLIAALHRHSRTAALSMPQPDHSRTNAISVGVSFALLLVSGLAFGTLAPDTPYSAFAFVLLSASAAAMLVRLVAPDTIELQQSQGVAMKSQQHRDFYRNAVASILMLGIIATVAVTTPWIVSGSKGLPLDLFASIQAPANARPEWYLMFAYGAVSVLSPVAVCLVLTVIGILLFMVPVIARSERSATLARVAAIVAALTIAALTMAGYFRPQ